MHALATCFSLAKSRTLVTCISYDVRARHFGIRDAESLSIPEVQCTIAMVSTKVLVVKRQAMLSTTTVHRIQCIFCSIISAKVPHDAGKCMYKMPCWATKCDVNNLIVLLLPLFTFAGNTGGGGTFKVLETSTYGTRAMIVRGRP